MGKSIGNMSARGCRKGYSLKAFDTVKEALGRLQKSYDTIVIEGAGSPAEVNLKANDIVNMRVAKVFAGTGPAHCGYRSWRCAGFAGRYAGAAR